VGNRGRVEGIKLARVEPRIAGWWRWRMGGRGPVTREGKRTQRENGYPPRERADRMEVKGR